jgi:nucleoside-diphosphate-sugar epimerase
MKRVIITGASGFVGANLARRLVADGHEVHLFLRPGTAAPGIASPGIAGSQPALMKSSLSTPGLWRLTDILDNLQTHFLTLSDRQAVARTVSSIKPDWIFHLAVHGAYSWQTDLFEMIETNLTSTASLLEACLKTGFESFVNTGSSSEYGFKDHPPAEDEALEPNSYYAVTKASATMLCRHIAASKKVSVPTLRLYSVFGLYEDPRRLIPTLITKGLSGKLPVLVDPDIARDYVYVDDVIDAYLLAASTPSAEPGAVYNVGTGVQTSLREIVDVARTCLPIKEEPSWGTMPNRAWDSSSWVSNNSKLKSLGWKPRHSLSEGFAKTVNWLKSAPNLRRFYEECITEKTSAKAER